MNILITGITGFVGSHMADFLLKEVANVKIYAIKRWRSPIDNIKHLMNHPQIEFIECDLTDRVSIDRALSISKPDLVYHFAAQSFPGSSFLTPVHTLNTNVIGTTNLFEAVRTMKNRSSIDPLVVSVSSSEVYGMPEKDEIPIKETNPIRAANPYSISKVGHDLMSQYYSKAYGIRTIITRMFSHEGSRRGKMFALSSFAHQIVQHEKSEGFPDKKPYTVFHGNLDSVRTYNHIDDAIEAYWMIYTHGKEGEIYNIGGDDTHTIGEALEMLIANSKNPGAFVTAVDPARVRPTDITLQIPDSTKFREHTGWKPVKGLQDIVEDLLNYWREML